MTECLINVNCVPREAALEETTADKNCSFWQFKRQSLASAIPFEDNSPQAQRQGQNSRARFPVSLPKSPPERRIHSAWHHGTLIALWDSVCIRQCFGSLAVLVGDSRHVVSTKAIKGLGLTVRYDANTLLIKHFAQHNLKVQPPCCTVEQVKQALSAHIETYLRSKIIITYNKTIFMRLRRSVKRHSQPSMLRVFFYTFWTVQTKIISSNPFLRTFTLTIFESKGQMTSSCTDLLPSICHPQFSNWTARMTEWWYERLRSLRRKEKDRLFPK